MSSSARWLLLLVPGLMFFYTLGGSPIAAEAAPRGGGQCRKCPPPDGGTDGGTGSDGGTSPDAGTGYDAGTPDAGYDAGTPDAGTPDAGSGSDAGTPPPTGCLGQPLLDSLGKDHVLVGAKTNDDVVGLAPFDIRYIYLAGGLFDSQQVCSSCMSCSTAGQSCSSSNPSGCGWWGCWQWDQVAPGQFLRDFLTQTRNLGQLPMLTYYEILHTSRVAEGAQEVAKAQDAAMMQRYYNDWRFVLQQVGTSTVLLHIEPDFWAYAQHVNTNPHMIPAAVASANPTDCSGFENSIAGMGRCMIAMARKYAPNAKVSLHASAWATKIDAMMNQDPSLNVEAEAVKVADFLRECGGGSADFVVVETSDRDAQYYQVRLGRNSWWDPTNTTLPHFRQAFRFAKALSERMGLPNMWWQIPVGNMSMPGYDQHWKDNRLDYFFDHPQEVAAAHGIGMIFGAGEQAQTNPSTDNGHALQRANAYFFNGGQPACLNMSLP
ncbi:hypothetical protein [Vitiosangium sp. GDMCC 1.1324]|uniref:hypothetical protein n=1 Tax=Vitiosangium sp. (strain GDMCC 1.1324) TaxID=2138576 RepID=UPI0018EEB1B6|nr:hypothetical protein [Vitiosangium sp. GDMCC 1.1324]